MPNNQTFNEEAKKRVLLHIGIAGIWFLIFVWPIAKVFNRIEPYILGIPCYVFMVWVLGPLVIFLNILAYLRWFAKVDAAEMAGRGKEV